MILEAYRVATVGESSRLDRVVENDIRASKAADRRNAAKLASNFIVNLVIVGASVWAFVATGNPLPLALPGASVISSVVVSIGNRRKDS